MKKGLSIVLLLAMILQTAYCVSASAEDSGTPKHIPRVVSVVFDDSGSMYFDSDKWAYASYAMQAFCAMMGEEDVLYVTYMNATSKSGKVDISDSKKQATIDLIEETMFGGTTPNRMEDAAKLLVNEYKKYGKNAKYYLVAMTDGKLDSKEGSFEEKLPKASKIASDALIGADYEAIYFSMDGSEVRGVTSYKATTGEEIVDELRMLSAEIMGRTDITSSCKFSGNKVSFKLDYPALSVAIFTQKNGTSLNGVNVSVKKNSANASCNVKNYYIDCPSKITVNDKYPIYSETYPASPPSGVVSLVDNNASSLAKGEYTVTFSGCNATKDQVVVLVEPAVKIGCVYYIGDSVTPLSFDEMMKQARAGEDITVKCGLYELNEDGTLGDEVSESIIAPTFDVSVDGKEVGNKVQNDKNAYTFKLDESFENKDLKIEASIENYAPFVYRETFGKILPKLTIDPNVGSSVVNVNLTLDLWNSWKDGKETLDFPLENITSDTLSYLDIKVSGTDIFPTGKCSSLDGVYIKGNVISYVPKPNSDAEFADLPNAFDIVLSDSLSGESVVTVKVKVVTPSYKIEVNNPFEGVNISLDMLKTNTIGVIFTLMSDLDGDGVYDPCSNGEFTVSHGDLPGKVESGGGKATFTPFYDDSVDTSKYLGKEHKLKAEVTVDSSTVVKSEEIIISIATPEYKFVIGNPFDGQKIDLGTFKTNTSAITFTLMVDYAGNGEYVAVTDDVEMTIECGKLTGDFSADGNVGSFVISYDPDVNTAVAPTDLLGKDHTVYVTAAVNGVTVKSDNVIVSLESATYKIVAENYIASTFTLDTIKNNDLKIVFSLQADYEGDGTFGAIASWDTGVYDLLTITAGDLPGIFSTEYDAGGVVVGKSFTPQYDENNNGGVVFTRVAGKVHTVKAEIEQYNVSSETTVEVLAPVYDISVRKDGIIIVDIDLRKNTDGVEFVVSRDGRILTAEELEGLAPYSVALDKNKDSVKLELEVKTDEMGNSYLFCRPAYNGWTFISSAMWSWMCLFTVKDGDMHAVYTLGENSASARIHVDTNGFAWTILISITATIALIVWMVFCFLTRTRLSRGVFYICTFKKDEPTASNDEYQLVSLPSKVKSYGFRHFFHGSLLIPCSVPKIPLGKGCTVTCEADLSKARMPMIEFKEERNGRKQSEVTYEEHICGSIEGTDFNKLIANKLRSTDKISLPVDSLDTKTFMFRRQSFVVFPKTNINDKRIKIITFAKNREIKKAKDELKRQKNKR